MVSPDAIYHEVTQVANKYCSHCDKTSKNCGRQRLKDNVRKHTHQRKTVFYIELLSL